MKPRDPMLDALADALRRQDPLADPRWDRLVDGSLTLHEAEALQALVDRGGAPDCAYEALRPLAEPERWAILEAVLGPEIGPGPGTTTMAPGEPAADGDTRCKVLEFPPRGAVRPKRRSE